MHIIMSFMRMRALCGVMYVFRFMKYAPLFKWSDRMNGLDPVSVAARLLRTPLIH